MNMIKKLFRADSTDVLVAKRGFAVQSHSMIEHLEKIGEFFLLGYHKTLETPSLEGIYEYLESLDADYQGFAYEGAGMGLALLDAIPWEISDRFQTFLEKYGNPHIYMMHVGAGWAFAKLPFVNIEKRIHRFDSVLKWLILDGYGFHQAYFKTPKYVYNRKFPKELKSDYAPHAFYQGLGRALWFVYGGQADLIIEKIKEFPTRFTGDLYGGLGLAASYAGGVKEETLELIRHHSKGYQAALAQGAAFASAARIRAGNLGEKTGLAAIIFSDESPKELANIAHHHLKVVREECPKDKQVYDCWRQKIMNSLKINANNELEINRN